MNTITQRSKIFNSQEESVNQTTKLLELLTINSNLSVRRDESLQKIIEIFNRNLLNSENQALNSIKENLIRSLAECSSTGLPTRRVSKTITNSLISKIEEISSIEELMAISKKTTNYCTTLRSISLPIKKSANGYNGPTLLVHYTKPSKSGEKQVAYVLKWTQKEETAGNLLYNFFIRHTSSKLAIPAHTWHDFEARVYKNINDELEDLNDPLSLSKALLDIPMAMNPNMKLFGDKVMIIEKIQGDTLYEFARFKYESLSESQKTALFLELGKLAILDLLLGNTDRLQQPKWSNFHPELDTYRANLGNIMLSSQENGDIKVHPIDNAVEESLITEPKKRTNYSAFIHSLFATKESEKVMSSAVVGSLQTALTRAVERARCDNEAAAEALQQQLQPMLDDLQRIALPVVEEGMKQMIHSLRNTLIPAWHSERSALLKEQMGELHPELLTVIEEHIQVFTNEQGNF
ncbi:MAG: hypothetical protein Q8L98_03430 [Chlamydiales bacterium]|nr:hypothetical protein [Chlamydiales bacterium]